MTHTKPIDDGDGEFGPWRDHSRPCARSSDGRPDGAPCGARVQCRLWESRDGAYEDHQYRCDQGHVWWVDGIDS